MPDETNADYARDRQYAWDYFTLHSSQRITTFNFYITLALAVVAGLGTVFQLPSSQGLMTLIASLLLVILSFIFYQLDRRNKMLVQRAETALKSIEQRIAKQEKAGDQALISLFLRDEEEVKRRRSKKSLLFWRNFYSYSDCFNLIFWIFGLLGAGGAVVSIFLF